MEKNLFVALLMAGASVSPLLAHSGGTDSNGCHTNRKTGDYHCHGGRSAPAAPMSRMVAPSPPSPPPVIRRATREEIEKPRQVPSSFLPPPAKAPEYTLEVEQRTRLPGDGIEVIRPKKSEMVHLAQLLLRGQKHEITDPPGELGYSTFHAIRIFQSRYQERPDGRVSAELLRRLIEAAPARCD